MEAKLQKLKVTELKELLAKNHLVQTGKKDDLVKRLMENNIAPEGDDEDELVDPDGDDNGAADDTTAAEPSTSNGATNPPSTKTAAPAATSSESSTTLTAEQQAMKARAERFGIPFNPNPTPTNRTAGTSSQAIAAPSAPTNGAASTAAPTTIKAGAIDKAPLEIDEEVLAKRAAKFGIPEKKEKETPVAPAKTTKPEPEITPEMAEKIAIEEEKKRKRAEKFGTGKPATNGASTEPEAKKVKV